MSVGSSATVSAVTASPASSPRGVAVNGAGVAERDVVADRAPVPARPRAGAASATGRITTGMRDACAVAVGPGELAARVRVRASRSCGVNVTVNGLGLTRVEREASTGATDGRDAGQPGDARPCTSRRVAPTLVTVRVTVWTPARSPIAIDAHVEVARVDRVAGADERGAGSWADAGRRPAQEREPVVEAAVVDEAGIGRAVRLRRDRRPGGRSRAGSCSAPSRTSVGRRHERRLDRHRRPVGVQVLAAARARPATCGLDIDVPLKRLKSRPCVAGRRDRSEDVLAGSDDVRLQQVAAAGRERTARRERRP